MEYFAKPPLAAMRALDDGGAPVASLSRRACKLHNRNAPPLAGDMALAPWRTCNWH